MKRKFKVLKQLWTPFTKSRAGIYASSACYYTLLSIPSTFLLLSYFIPRFSFFSNIATTIVTGTVPSGLLKLFHSITDVPSSPRPASLVSFSFLITLWTSAKGISSIIEGMRAMFRLPERGFLKRRLRDAVLLLLMLLLLLLIAVVIVAVHYIISLVAGLLFLPQHKPILPVIIRYSLQALILSFLFLSGYYLLFRQAGFLNTLISGALAAVLWTLFSELFSLYFQLTFQDVSTLAYLKTLFAAMLWLRTSSLIILYGAVLCRLLTENSYHPIRVIRDALKTK